MLMMRMIKGCTKMGALVIMLVRTTIGQKAFKGS